MGRHHGSRHSGSHHRSSSHRSSSHRSSSHRSSSHSRSGSYHSHSGAAIAAASYPQGYRSDQQYRSKPTHPTGEYQTLWYDDETGGFSYSYKSYPYIKDTVDRHIREKEPPVIHYLSLSQAMTGAFFLFIFALANLPYEIFIIPFECIDMSDQAFCFIDDLLYVGQYLIAMLPIIKSIIDSKKMKKYKFEVTKQAVEYYKLQEKMYAERESAELERKVMLTVCPSCGAPIEQDTGRYCPYCNTVLERYTDNGNSENTI